MRFIVKMTEHDEKLTDTTATNKQNADKRTLADRLVEEKLCDYSWKI